MKAKDQNRAALAMREFASALDKTKSYHDTTQAVDLQEREKKAKSQDEIILEWFKISDKEGIFFTDRRAFTPWDVFEYLDIDLQDIRRSITNLTKTGKLIKTADKVMECKGAYNYLWKLNK